MNFSFAQLLEIVISLYKINISTILLFTRESAPLKIIVFSPNEEFKVTSHLPDMIECSKIACYNH